MADTELRRSGIAPVDDLPWGSHICSFYETKKDLLDLLVPYIKAGLESNERCFWVTADITVDEAMGALREALPSLEEYMEKGQIIVLPHEEWYLPGGSFDMNVVLDSWAAQVDEAISLGYDGLRVTGNTAWLESQDWDAFKEYERTIDSAIDGSPILVL